MKLRNVCAALGVVLAILTVAYCDANVLHAATLTAIMVPVMRRDSAELARMLSAKGSDMVGYRAPYFDTQLFTSASTTQLTFFGTISTDKSMTNMKGANGAFPNNYYFVPLTLSFDVLADASTGLNTELGVLDDINKLVLVNRGWLQLTVGSVQLPGIPLSYLHASGGAVGNLAGTWTAPVQVQVGTNGVQDGGYFLGGSFVLGAQLPFSAVVTWPNTVTLASGNTNCRLSFDGDWYQPVQ